MQFVKFMINEILLPSLTFVIGVWFVAILVKILIIIYNWV